MLLQQRQAAAAAAAAGLGSRMQLRACAVPPPLGRSSRRGLVVAAAQQQQQLQQQWLPVPGCGQQQQQQQQQQRRRRRGGLLVRRAQETDADAPPRVPDAPPAPSGGGSSSNGGGGGSSSNGGSAPASPLSSVSRAVTPSSTRPSSAASSVEEDAPSAGGWAAFLGGPLPGKVAALVGLIVLSRVGVYVRLPGVDVDAFSAAMRSNGLLGYVDALSGGSISKVGLFSLGIIPYINASIVLQLMSAAFPSLKKMQREDGPQGRARFQYYQKLAAFVFAIAQAVGQLTYIRPYVTDFGPEWLAGSTLALVAGALALVYIADTISELKLGNGTSVLIFANIASSLPGSVGALLAQNAESDPANVAVYAAAFFLTTLGIIYVQEAERRIPVNYGSRYQAGALARQSYLPFKVNATGVMPLIFASSLLGLPLALARLADSAALERAAAALGPGGALYLPVNVALIAFFNYYYTFLQLEPKDLSEQLKRAGAAIPGIRPGRATAEYVASTLTRMSLLGSVFLGALSLAPAAVEGITHLSAFRGFAGTSVLIMVGVATDTARRLRAEQAMAKYQDVDKLYDDLRS